MATKKTKELKSLSQDERATRLREAELALFQARMKKVTGQLANTASIWKMRKDIARLKTFQAQASAPVVAAAVAKKTATKAKATAKKA